MKLDENGSVVGATKVDLHKLMDRIRQLSGGRVPVGKGLTLGLSTLECYLANDKKTRPLLGPAMRIWFWWIPILLRMRL